MYIDIASSFQAVLAISDIRRDIPIHLELASMTDKDYMNSIMQEVHVENSSRVPVTEKIQMSLIPKEVCIFNI